MEQLAVSWFAACVERGNISTRAAEREKTIEPKIGLRGCNDDLHINVDLFVSNNNYKEDYQE